MSVAQNSSTSVHPHGSGFAVPPGRDRDLGTMAKKLQEASRRLGNAGTEAERHAVLRGAVEADDELAAWLGATIIKAAPDAAAGTVLVDTCEPGTNHVLRSSPSVNYDWDSKIGKEASENTRREVLQGGGAYDPGELDTSCLSHGLTMAEETQFARDGFFCLHGALDSVRLARLRQAAARIDGEYREKMGINPSERMDLLDAVGLDPELLELVDWHTTLPKVWGLLGWNVKLYHTQISLQPPLPPGTPQSRFGWHRDSGRLNSELDGWPARVSIKVGFFLQVRPFTAGLFQPACWKRCLICDWLKTCYALF